MKKMRTQTTADLREKIINLLAKEAKGMTLRDVNRTIVEVDEALNETAIINLIECEADKEPLKQILPPFDPTLHGFMVDAGDPPNAWLVRVSRVPHAKFIIQHLHGDDEWQIDKYTKDPFDPIPDAHYTGKIPDNNFGAELLRNMGLPKAIVAGHNIST